MHNFKSWTVKTSAQTVVCGTRVGALKTIVLAAKAGCRDIEVTIQTSPDRKSTRLNSSHVSESRMPSSA